MRFSSTILTLLSLFAYSSFSYSQQIADTVAPELGDKALTQSEPAQSLTTSSFMVVTAHPLATQAGYDMIIQGGNAIDAMVAVQAVLGLVEPQSSGLGGGAFLLYFDSQSKKLRTFDARETSPLEAPDDLFLDSEGQKMAFFDAVVGGRSVGTPGTPKLLWTRHKESGLLSWREVLKPAIKLAEEGFLVTPRMASALTRDISRLSLDPEAKALYYPNGKALQAGQKLINIDYANTLKLLSKHGGDYFYSKPFAASIIDKVRAHPNKGYLSQADFDAYKVIERPAVCSSYLAYAICGMGPPSSGAITVGQTLAQLDYTDFSSLDPESSIAWHYVAESSRLAFADRGRYIADTDFVPLPNNLLSSPYLQSRASLINKTRPSKEIKPGVPDPKFANQRNGVTLEQPSTSHFVIVDKSKNIVSMTTTIENGFGSRQMVNGFLLNNELTDFSFASKSNGDLIANRVQKGKRPRSSMAPTIVFKNNSEKGGVTSDSEPYLAIGSPGGSRIIPYVANTLVRVLGWNQTPHDAINKPHLVNRFGALDIENHAGSDSYLEELKAIGYQVNQRDLNSGLHGVWFKDGKLVSAVDSRREGTALGQ